MSLPRDLQGRHPRPRRATKINAAYSYGGPTLAIKTISSLLGAPDQPLVNVNFGASARRSTALGCVYVDVDRRYYHSNLGLPPSQQYAEINVKPGYQKLCGQKALDYVRFRHDDTDLVRAARQQDFLRQAKRRSASAASSATARSSCGSSARTAQTDTQLDAGDPAAAEARAQSSASNPIQRVQFRGHARRRPGVRRRHARTQLARRSHAVPRRARPAEGAARPRRPRRASRRSAAPQRRRHAAAPSRPRGRQRRPARTTRSRRGSRASSASAARLLPRSSAHDAGSLRRRRTARASTRSRDRDGKHAQGLPDRRSTRATIGQYYGVQGTTWHAPPILDNPSRDAHDAAAASTSCTTTASACASSPGGPAQAVYWVSNTLPQTLTNKQMLGIARSLTPRRRH